MRTFEDFLQELELLDTFQQLGRMPDEKVPSAIVVVPKVAGHEERAGNNRPPLQAAKTAAVTSITIDPARAARIATMDWAELKAETAACTACGLCKQRKQAVFGVGAAPAPWLFVGEGPGAEEDEQGEPFVGQAGRLLDAVLAAAGLQRGREVYIANVVKCRPPGNRTPTLEEAAACAPLLDRQIELIQPKLIVALGKTAVIRLTGSDASMAAMRGSVHRYRDVPVVATYHPAYLLRSLTEKLKAWEDMMFARREMAKRGASGLENG
ncbi:MAG: uracil-DNA glycosylase [Burkholderiales bacterium]|nr:uracil-DNA glycosylase [Burkholderiales bacterium]